MKVVEFIDKQRMRGAIGASFLVDLLILLDEFEGEKCSVLAGKIRIRINDLALQNMPQGQHLNPPEFKKAMREIRLEMLLKLIKEERGNSYQLGSLVGVNATTIKNMVCDLKNRGHDIVVYRKGGEFNYGYREASLSKNS